MLPFISSSLCFTEVTDKSVCGFDMIEAYVGQ